MSIPNEMSLPVYLRHNNIQYADGIEYDVSAQVDLITFQAYHLAQMQSQPLHAVHLLKSILHIPGSAAEQRLIQYGLTLEKIHATTLNPNDPPFKCAALFSRMIKYAKKSPTLDTRHLLLALLEEEVLRPYFASWHIQIEDVQNNENAQAG